jgi:hypothetical protein
LKHSINAVGVDDGVGRAVAEDGHRVSDVQIAGRFIIHAAGRNGESVCDTSSQTEIDRHRAGRMIGFHNCRAQCADAVAGRGFALAVTGIGIDDIRWTVDGKTGRACRHDLRDNECHS